MIAIAVVASLVAYAWVMGYMNFQQGKIGQSIQIPSFALDGSGQMLVYVQNVGQGQTEIGAVYINNVLIEGFTANPSSTVPEKSTVELTVPGTYNKDTTYEIKVTTTDGTFMTATGKPGGSGTPVGPAALVASVSPVGPLTMTNGQTQIFTASSTGGTGAKSYQWYLDGSAISGEVSSTYTYTVASGAHEIYVVVTDSAATPVSDDSNTVSVTGTDALTANIAPEGPISLAVDESQTFTANVGGGIGAITYQWYLDDAEVSAETGSTYEYTAETASSTHTVQVKVTDSASTPVTVDSNTVTVNVAAAKVQINFRQNGAGSDATQSIVTIDSTDYTYTQLQTLSFNWVPGSQHSISARSTVSTSTWKQYVWTSWSISGSLHKHIQLPVRQQQ